jgi:SAM-dependent methyltransferase
VPEPGWETLTAVPLISSDSSEHATQTEISADHRGQFCCVVDDHPRFHLDALRWFVSLTDLAGVEPGELVVHVVGPESSRPLDYLRSSGVTVRGIERFDPRSPHCNKISGALRLAEDGVEGMAVLCDTDLAVLEDPRQLAIPPGSIAGKPVDAPVPPLDVLLGIFTAAGVPLPHQIALPWGDGQRTLSGNNNGGLYLVPGPLLPTVATSWAHWAHWLLDRLELLEDWAVYVDQVAMALGLAAEGVTSQPLDVRWNTPTHDLTRIPADAPVPAILHYHQEVDRQGLIRLTGIGSIDQQIEVVNDAIKVLWRQALPDTTYWEWFYLTESDPDVATDIDATTRRMLSTLLESIEPASVFDVGCGDGRLTSDLPLPRYSGIDLSAEAVRRARLLHPTGEFVIGSLDQSPMEADLVLCIDVLPHQSDEVTYEKLIQRLWQSAGRALVLSGLESSGDSTAPTLHFHEPLSTTLERVIPEAEVYPIRRQSPFGTFLVLRPPKVPHQRDYGSATMAPLMGRHPDPLGLAAIRLHAWRTLGFYPDHSPRLWEYPVVASTIREHLRPGSRLVDVGAGTTPLAPYLTSQGYVVDTVDPSETQRAWPPAPDWNEWGFLDYGKVGMAHRSWNCTLDELPLRPVFDGAYSVSVIEHIRADERRSLLADIAARVRPGGLVVLTIDLVRDSETLWNRNLGQVVEEPSRHGTFQDVVTECAAVGLELLHRETVRQWGDTHVDIGLLALRRTDDRVPGGWQRTAHSFLRTVRKRRS